MNNLDVDPSQDFDAGTVVASQPEVLAPEAEPKEPARALPAVKGFSTSETGLMTLQTLAEQKAFAKRLIDEKMISSSFKTPEQVIIGIQYSKAMQLEPVVALRMMYVVNGKPSLFGEGPLALCHRANAVKDIEEFFVEESGRRISVENENLRVKVFGAITRVWRVGQDRVQEDYFTLDDLKRAGIDIDTYKQKRKDVWEKYERVMCRYKARAMALRTKFPDLIAGIPISEWDDHFSPETPEVEPPKPTTVADEINGKYLAKPEGAA